MTNRIHLAGIIEREGRILLVRPTPRSLWEPPGGAMPKHLDDADLAMAELLQSFGITMTDPAERFIETIYLPADDGQTIYNLYATSEWSGEPEIPIGMGASWYALDELDSIEMEGRVRHAIQVAYGLKEAENTEPAILAAVIGSQPEAPAEEVALAIPPAEIPAETSWANPAPTAEPVPAHMAAPEPEPVAIVDQPAVRSRREAGFDVLRTMGRGEPEVAFERMKAQYPELAADIVDFALGEVWANETLSRRDRSLLVVAMLSALGGRTGPLSHINGALNHGASPDEVVETLRMVAVYAGFPAALEAWGVMEDVFRTRRVAPRSRES